MLHAHVLNSQQLSHSSSGLSARNHLAPAASPHIRDSRDFSISPSHDFAPRDSDPLQFIESCSTRDAFTLVYNNNIICIVGSRNRERENGIEKWNRITERRLSTPEENGGLEEGVVEEGANII